MALAAIFIPVITAGCMIERFPCGPRRAIKKSHICNKAAVLVPNLNPPIFIFTPHSVDSLSVGNNNSIRDGGNSHFLTPLSLSGYMIPYHA